MSTVVGAAPRYRAFISYSHRDQAFARRLHRALEAYRMPGRLAGRLTAQGVVPGRLSPIFRDREELSAAGNLSDQVQAALADAASLIVICSPTAAASQWVGREIELFRRLHPDRPVLAALALGEPGEAFPAALVEAGADGAPIEPLAADFRRGHDGARLGLVKLVAGMVGVGLDELIQRDSQRRVRRVTAVTIGSVVAMLAMGVLTVAAMQARADAERQRAKAEGLVEFMLTDLRARLKGVGRLDVMAAANTRALRYYRDEDLARLPAESLIRRARLLQAIGEDDNTRGDPIAARAQFNEARRTTQTLLDADPDNPDRIFAHAQSEFWVATVAYEQDHRPEARKGFMAYKRLADRLVALDPHNPTYIQEAAYAEGGLCTADLMAPADGAAAVRECGAALEQMEAADRHRPMTPALTHDLVNRHAWLATAYRADRQFDKARTERLAEEALLNGLITADPANMRLRQDWVVLQNALADLDIQTGKPELGRARLVRARSVVQGMIAFDHTNRFWRSEREFIDEQLAKIDNKTAAHQNSPNHP